MEYLNKVFLTLLAMTFIVFSVFAADKQMRNVDNNLEQVYEDLKAELDEDYTDDIYNDLLRQEIINMRKRATAKRYQDMGFYLSNTFNNGDRSEINRIYNCILP